ncbi:hypothetical protein RA11412_1678 [Rothia aeria]|uniref:Uncharacterized protein n=1 Tax=Rothia aeria TaxID=172042 RepID=A0A2Z5QZV4_9MICC|nr:hypothetical protein RA11412_1678 [Rothia aeria]
MAVAKLPQVQYRKGATTKVDQHEIIDHWFEVPLTHGLIFLVAKMLLSLHGLRIRALRFLHVRLLIPQIR